MSIPQRLHSYIDCKTPGDDVSTCLYTPMGSTMGFWFSFRGLESHTFHTTFHFPEWNTVRRAHNAPDEYKYFTIMCACIGYLYYFAGRRRLIPESIFIGEPPVLSYTDSMDWRAVTARHTRIHTITPEPEQCQKEKKKQKN